jgi:Uma2 family endonuclease
MSTTLASLEEYLSTSYSPDREYVDGVVVERNWGEKSHSKIQRNLILLLSRKYPELHVWPELRMRTRGTRHRIPDVCVTLDEPGTEVLQEPPFLTIEILSADDRMSAVLEKLQEYESVGVPNIWLIDPRLQQAYYFQDGDLHESEGDSLTTTGEVRAELRLDEIFSA